MKRKTGLLLASCMALTGLLAGTLGILGIYTTTYAVSPTPAPQSGSVGVEGRISSPAPTQAATIGVPRNGQTFTSIPITVSGLCPANTLVKIFSNEIFVGSAVCANGSYSLQISLFSGRNDLIARVFDSLDQQGPDSAVVTVTFNDAQFAQFGTHVAITSQYARRAADPGKQLEWPIVIAGGLGPYALSVDWGDGTPAELHSEPFAGTFTLRHTYKASGVYNVTFKVVDHNGTAGFLQVIAVATGNIGTNDTDGKPEKTVIIQREILWWPMALFILPSILSFWLGMRYELSRLRRQLAQDV